MDLIAMAGKIKARDNEVLKKRAIKKKKLRAYKSLAKKRTPVIKKAKKKFNKTNFMKAINNPYK